MPSPSPSRIRLRSTTPPPSDTVVFRAGGLAPEIRGDRRLCFYAAVFDRPSQSMPASERSTVQLPPNEVGKPFVEIVRPGAFAGTIAAGGDVYACLEHDPTKVFSRRSTGLLLQEDDRGLFASCYLPPSPFHDQVLADVQSRRLQGCSFGFRTVEERSSLGPAGLQVELLAVHLVDVSLTRNPAYPGTVVSLRAEPAADGDRRRRLRLLKLKR